MKIIATICITTLLFTLTACHSHSRAVQKVIQQSRANMVYIPGGNYTMGPTDQAFQVGSNTPPHKVTLSSFYISKDNVSYGEYDTYTEATGKPYIDNNLRTSHDFARKANYPVEGITWYQAHDYCAWLAQKTSLPYALPTEAQWEYVARNLGKPNWAYATDDGTQKLGVNWPSDQMFSTQAGNITGDSIPLPVGSLPCTPMGICGLSGEVNEWVNDWYDRNYYAHSPVQNPQGPQEGKLKIIRGGGAGGSPDLEHNYGRVGQPPDQNWGGFRCVINSDLPLDKLGVYAKA